MIYHDPHSNYTNKYFNEYTASISKETPVAQCDDLMGVLPGVLTLKPLSGTLNGIKMEEKYVVITLTFTDRVYYEIEYYTK